MKNLDLNGLGVHEMNAREMITHKTEGIRLLCGKTIKNFYAWLYKTSIKKIVSLAIISSFLSTFIIITGYVLIGGDGESISDGYDLTLSSFFLVVLFAPFFETVLLQYFPLKMLSYAFKRKQVLVFCCIIPLSALFGVLHMESTIYMIAAFSFGLIWNFSCYLFVRRRQHPILYTTLIHSSYNFILFSLSWLIDL